MNWFQGSIPEAVQISRLSKGYLVVFVYDKEEASVESRRVLDKEEFVNHITLPEFTAIELENGSENAKQFSEIYPLVTVPSLFFIDGVSGVPIEVIGGAVKEEYLRTKLQELAQSTSPAPAQETTVKTPSPGPSSAEEPLPNVSSNETENSSSHLNSTERAENSAAAGASEASPDSTTEDELQQKVERARVLAEQLQIQKQKEAEENERKKEIERRKMGMEMAKAKAKREELELEQAVRQRKKDKEEERLARERVKAQIAADQADRKARAALLRGDMPESDSQPALSTPAPPVSKDSTVRIKFRMADGSSNIGLFKADDKLSALHDHLRLNVPSLPSGYMLVSALDLTKFTDEQLSSTLLELNLAPSAIVIVKVSSTQKSSALDTSSSIMNLLWVPLTCLSMVVATVLHFLGIGGPTPEQNQPDVSPPEAKKQRTDRSASPGTSSSEPQGAYRRERNIHRLRDGTDDDPDDNNTWNGNSTQQM